jgi:hypothetical protein
LFSSYQDLISALEQFRVIAQSPAAKFLFFKNAHDALLFVDGFSYSTSQAFAITLTDKRSNPVQAVIDSVSDPADQRALLELYNSGCLRLL